MDIGSPDRRVVAWMHGIARGRGRLRPGPPAWAAALSLALSACAGAPVAPGAEAADVPEIMPGVLAGYLAKEQLPDSLTLLPPPPAPGSAALSLDEEIHRNAASLRGTARWALAASDADLNFPHAAGTFDCALGVAVDPTRTPRLYRLLQRSIVDAGLSTSRAKHHYERTRPFVLHEETTCRPEDEAALRKDGSYPSGHTTLGWAASLVLVEVDPANTDALLARGRSYGESRLVCNVHWQSDVLQGRVMGAATVARLRAVPQFTRDVAAAREELAAARTRGDRPARDCAAEAAALAQSVPGVL